MTTKPNTMPKEKNIMLIISESCNLNCIYCYEHHKTASKMSFTTAKAILDKELKDPAYEQYMIQLFGGEPFTNFELIRQLYDYLEENYTTTKYHCFITTNGTLLTPAIKAWLRERKKKITVGVSLDGTKAMHDCNRSNSFDKIDLDFFLENYPKQIIKMTISPPSLQSLAEGILFLQKKGFVVSATFAQGVEYTEDSLKLLKEQLAILTEYYINHPDMPICDIVDYSRLQLLNTATEVREKWCGCGQALKAFDFTGHMYPCQLFSPISLGASAEEFRDKDEAYLKAKGSFLDPKCKTCFIQPLCPTCCGINYLVRQSLADRDVTLCNFAKLRFYYAALLCYHKGFKARGEELLSVEEFHTLKGILKIIQHMEEDPELQPLLNP